MCHGCWSGEYGEAQIDTPEVRAAAVLVARVYEFSGVGGGVHCVVEDWNIEDEFLDGRYSRPDDPPEQVLIENELLAALRTMTLAERASVLALHDEFWSAPHG